jgi:hypothetical protein
MSSRWRHCIGPALILLAAAVACAGLLWRGNSCGHDFDFHLVSWLDAQSGWRQGILYPHWTPSANFGAGEPRFIFYPPLTWTLGAALGFVLPWQFVGKALTFLILAATGLATRALARQALSDGPATLAGCAAVFSGYTLFTAYERSAFGELTGGFWIPLLLLLILRERNPAGSVIERALDGSTVPLSLAVAGAWLSNAPVGVMACYLLAAIALVLAVLSRSWAPIVRAAAAAGVGMGLAAIYLVPAAWEQRWVDIRQATGDPGEMIENSWLFARHANPLLELHDIELLRVSAIAVSMIAVAAAGLLVVWLRGRLSFRNQSSESRLKAMRWWLPLALIPFVILFLQLPVSLPVWNLLPRLRFLQFPWRWLVVLEAPMAIFFAAAVWPSQPRKPARLWPRVAVVAICAVIFLAASAAAAQLFFQECDDEDNVFTMVDVYRTGAGFAGTDEYAPLGADNSLLASGLPSACLLSDPATVLGQSPEGTMPVWSPQQGSCEATFAAARNQAEHLRIAALTPHSGFLILRLRRYPAWRVKVNGLVTTTLPQRDDGLMAVPVRQGPVDVTVDWTTTSDVIVGRWLSIISALLLIALWLLERKMSPPRL